LYVVPPLFRKEPADLFDGAVPAPNFKERSGDPAHHPSQERGSYHVHPHLVSHATDFSSMEGPIGIGYGPVQFFREAPEIVRSN
jgi:hypothetical protein